MPAGVGPGVAEPRVGADEKPGLCCDVKQLDSKAVAGCAAPQVAGEPAVKKRFHVPRELFDAMMSLEFHLRLTNMAAESHVPCYFCLDSFPERKTLAGRLVVGLKSMWRWKSSQFFSMM